MELRIDFVDAARSSSDEKKGPVQKHASNGPALDFWRVLSF